MLISFLWIKKFTGVDDPDIVKKFFFITISCIVENNDFLPIFMENLYSGKMS